MKMLKILLLNLSIIKFHDDLKEMYNPPLGLLYMASSLELAGHQVKIIDYISIPYSRKELHEEIRTWKPDLVGISVYTENVDAAFKVCKGIKKIFPWIKTVLGGPQASLEPDYTISNDMVDYVIKYEGEAAMLELAEALASSEKVVQIKDVRGIVCRRDHKIWEDKKRYGITDLDLLAFPLRKKNELSQYGSVINIITSRGCPGKCIYCSATALSGARYRVRSVADTLLECAYLIALFQEQLKVIYFLDDTFTAIQERVFEFVKLKKSFHMDFLWRCESRVDVVNEEMVKRLAESACVGVAFGVESGSQEVLEKIHKQISLTQVEYIVELMHRYHIYTSLNFMLGHYCDTKESMNATYEFIRKMFEKYKVGIFTTFNTPFPGTWQRTHSREIGIKLKKSDYSEYSVLNPSIEGACFTVEDQVEVYNKILPMMYENDFGLR
jgi:anaerobic magnesium-protoporphyrin IX monomethyl ester cyclase